MSARRGSAPRPLEIMTLPNKNVTVTLRDLTEYTKSPLTHDVLAYDTFAIGRDQLNFSVRIDALAIILCSQGTSSMVINLTEFEVKANTLIVLQPENFVQVKEISDDFKSHIVFCGKNVVEQVLPKMTAMLPLIMQHRFMPVQHLTDNEAEGIRSFYTFLKLKLEDPYTPFQRQKVLCMLQAALFEIMDIRLAHESVAPRKQTRKEEIMARFILEVCRYFQKERQVSFYAKKLCITPKHLSSVVKETSGRTAGEWIDHYVVMEAKMLLSTTDLTVQEISSQLNFANQSFFGKYFKHHTGIPPTEFRQQYTISKGGAGEEANEELL